MDEAKSVGYDDTQLEGIAAAKGMPEEEIVKLRQRIFMLRKQGNTSIVNVPVGRKYTMTSGGDENENDQTEEKKETGPEIFGSELFRNSHTSFQPNLNIPTQKGYIIGSGDQLNLAITKSEEHTSELQSL